MGLPRKVRFFCGMLLLATGCTGVGSPASSETENRSPPAIGSCPKGTDYKDGCAAASAGVPAFPSLLSGYSAQPPWNVAGVHYAVGVPSHLSLKDPTAAALPSGCSLNRTTVTCSGTVTLDGYDFSLHNGTALSIRSGNVTVKNCLFIVGTNQGALGKIVDVGGATDALFVHNEFDGANIAVTAQRGQTIAVTNRGIITFKYNYFHNSGGDMIDFGDGPQVNIVQYNLFKDIGLNTAHSDTLQWCGSVVSNSDLSFNTIVQTAPGLSGMGLIEPNSECSGAVMNNLIVHNNTLISKVRDNFAAGADVAQGAGPATADHVAVFDNYLDPTGIMKLTSSPWFPTGFLGDTLPHPSALHSMIDMTSGSPIPVPSRSNPTAISPHYYVYPDASGYTPGLSDLYSISVSPASGTLSTGQTITFTLEMDEPWDVTGTPRLLLNSGGTANYSAGSGTNRLAFTYTVGFGQSVTNIAITAIDLNGGMIKDAVGNRANMSGAVTTFSGLDVQ
jgi:hypothetical protein